MSDDDQEAETVALVNDKIYNSSTHSPKKTVSKKGNFTFQESNKDICLKNYEGETTQNERSEILRQSINHKQASPLKVDTDKKGIEPGMSYFLAPSPGLQMSLESDNFVDRPPLKKDYIIGIDSIPQQREALIAHKGGHLTIMLAGQSGLGKTTFVNTLFGTSILPSIWDEVGEASPNVTFKKTTSIVRHQAIVEENGISLKLTVIDTPGFGDSSNNSFSWGSIANYIDEQIRTYIFQEEQPDRKKMTDNRINCCLYFIPPSNKGLSPLDIETMCEISKRVNLIPIISKADAFSTQELVSFKEEIKRTIRAQGIKICEFIDKSDPECQFIASESPYAIVSSESKVMNAKGELVRGRKYKWGVAEVENPLHSDFSKLRETLMSRNLVDLVDSTEKYYEVCRRSMLKTRILQAKDSLNASEPTEKIVALKSLNYENPDENGLENYKCYQVYDKSYMDSMLIEWSPEYIHKQWEAKKRFKEVVNLEEKKFKDWKRALFDRQTSFNLEIEETHNKVKSMQKECHELESILLSERDSNANWKNWTKNPNSNSTNSNNNKAV